MGTTPTPTYRYHANRSTLFSPAQSTLPPKPDYQAIEHKIVEIIGLIRVPEETESKNGSISTNYAQVKGKFRNAFDAKNRSSDATFAPLLYAMKQDGQDLHKSLCEAYDCCHDLRSCVEKLEDILPRAQECHESMEVSTASSRLT